MTSDCKHLNFKLTNVESLSTYRLLLMAETKKRKQGSLKGSILSFSIQKNPHENLTKAKPVQCYWSYASTKKHQGSYCAEIYCDINQN